MHTIAGSAVLAMALAGCNDEGTGSDDAQGSAQEGKPSSSAPAKPSVPVKPGENPDDAVSDGADQPGAPDDAQPPDGGHKLAPDQLDASGLPKGHPKKVLVDGAKLTITAQESGCEKASAELGAQTGSKVVVTLVRTTPEDAQMCTMDVRFPPLTVELDKPIGDRTLVLKSEARKK